jgi:predicted alpha/beta hydrolase family esterase
MIRWLNLVTVLILAILVLSLGISSIRADQEIQPVIQNIGGMKVAVWNTPGNSAVIILQGGRAAYPSYVFSTNSDFIGDVNEYITNGIDVYQPLQYEYQNSSNWVANLVDAISQTHEKVAIVGYSAGGVVAANFLFSSESKKVDLIIIVAAPLKAPNEIGKGSIFDTANYQKLIVNKKVVLIYGSNDTVRFFGSLKEGGKLFAQRFKVTYFEIPGADHHSVYFSEEGKNLRVRLLKYYGIPEFPVPSAVIFLAILLSYLIKIRRRNK